VYNPLRNRMRKVNINYIVTHTLKTVEILDYIVVIRFRYRLDINRDYCNILIFFFEFLSGNNALSKAVIMLVDIYRH